MFERILVCLDGSSLSEQVLPYAAEEAARFCSEVVLLRVAGDDRFSPYGSYGSRTPDSYVAEIREQESAARSYLEKAAQPIRERGIEVRIETVTGVPAETIVAYAVQNDVGLIAMATHGDGGLKRAILGSTADQVLRESGLPMLVVRPVDKDD